MDEYAVNTHIHTAHRKALKGFMNKKMLDTSKREEE